MFLMSEVPLYCKTKVAEEESLCISLFGLTNLGTTKNLLESLDCPPSQREISYRGTLLIRNTPPPRTLQ